MRDPDWDAKTHIVNVRAHLAANRVEADSQGSTSKRPVPPAVHPEDGFADVVTVMGISPIVEERALRKAARAGTADEALVRLPLRPIFGRAGASLGFFAARVKEDYGNTRPAMRASLLALPLLAWLVFGGESTHGGAASDGSVVALPPSAVHGERSTATVPIGPIATAGAPFGTSPLHHPPIAPGSTPSLEARAANAAAQGMYDDAVDLYEELAGSRPDRPEFALVVQVLRHRRAARIPGSVR